MGDEGAGGEDEEDEDEDEDEDESDPSAYFVRKYPDDAAGKPIPAPSDEPAGASAGSGPQATNPWAPFRNRTEWEIARWAKLRGPTSTAFSELLQIFGVKELLNLSFNNTQELNKIIDGHLTTRRPHFERHEIIIQGESYHVYYRNVVECIRALFIDPDFSKDLKFAPERHFKDETCTTPVYHDMHTGKWWWKTQKAVDSKKRGGTIIPIIISSDKTTLTTFGGKTAYPVYMTIANIPKKLRRKPSRQAQVLIGYLPTTSLKHITNKAQRRRMIGNLFHSCVRKMLAPLEAAGKDGVDMQTADGCWRRCHPILAAYVGDYPEQLLVTCVKKGHCPMCLVKPTGIGDKIHHAPHRDLDKVMVALKTLPKGPTIYSKTCDLVDIKPIQHPFWENLPYANIYYSITPDVLHQLYQGTIKHLFAWLKSLYNTAEIDARCRRLPPNHQLRHFSNGISHMSRLTGKEHAQIAHIIVGLIIDARLPHHMATTRDRLIRATRALLDFVFLAQYPTHTSTTLEQLNDALERWHHNKGAFVTLGVRSDFKIPKFHTLEHYAEMITLFGTTDNYNTEYTERLHIDMAKDAYRSTNHKDEFPQMTLWLERREKVLEHEKCIQLRQDGSSHVQISTPWKLKMTKRPSARRLTFTKLAEQYHAVDFRQCLARFVISKQNPTYRWPGIIREAENLFLPENLTFPAYHYIKFAAFDPHSKEEWTTTDIIHAAPRRKNVHERFIPERFDTVIIGKRDAQAPIHRTFRIAQIRVVFTLPRRFIKIFMKNDREFNPEALVQDEDDSDTNDNDGPPLHLAYVELFTKLPANPEPHHGLYRVKRELKDGARVTRIIPVSHILRSVQLFPRFKNSVPAAWSSSNVLDQCSEFFVNSLSDREIFIDFLGS
ncbi:hypothetical protein BDN72DRAFT_928579 [Pluteus cervinus]|uniref:Uncharacterized protein n=1 Tax=Pluteus cervinus TaxID=181527 RepID=A0ACD3B625_9AGAR|nr:hypothetical protein BDN72DRAFT_928579 [Pluteus cervinus]